MKNQWIVSGSLKIMKGKPSTSNFKSKIMNILMALQVKFSYAYVTINHKEGSGIPFYRTTLFA
jgi:hypothetical protein